jgi:hypothetical protein
MCVLFERSVSIRKDYDLAVARALSFTQFFAMDSGYMTRYMLRARRKKMEEQLAEQEKKYKR